ncbi:hypothetical protein Peur_058655 [Populus x canadensis]
MNQKHKKNYIPAIHRSDGSFTSSATEVGDVFVTFFTQLLGTSRATSPLDESVVHSGPCVDSSLHVFLLANVSSDDIKKALFSIGDTKSPGPDGYFAFFFKKSWDMVGPDLYATVQGYFQSGQLLKQINHSIIALVPKLLRFLMPVTLDPFLVVT